MQQKIVRHGDKGKITLEKNKWTLLKTLLLVQDLTMTAILRQVPGVQSVLLRPIHFQLNGG